MDAQTQEQQQKDFLSSFFPLEITSDHTRGADPRHQPVFQYNGPAQSSTTNMQLAISPNSQINAELLGNLMAMQNIETQSAPLPQYNPSPQLLLEQQFKLSQLQQLQQLQNQIFQQQIALISGQCGPTISEPLTEPAREQPPQFNGLPTPGKNASHPLPQPFQHHLSGPSSELRAQQPTDFVSPMILHYTPRDPYSNQNMSSPQHSVNSQYGPPRGSTSAPAHVAFHTSPSMSVPLSTDLDFDISPLTSPWLGAHQQTKKRTASSSGDETSSRKRLSPAIRATNPAPTTKKALRGSKSTSSTPLLRSTRSRKGSTAGDGVGDTPSPVDLSMPPPAPPASQFSPSSPSQLMDNPPRSPHVLTPVTPASIMNLGRLGINSGLAPPVKDQNSSTGKATARPKATTDSTARSKPSRKGSLISPSLKTILPAGNTSSLTLGSSMPHPQPIMQVRKTSHKAAEQKRRDSLKTTFDDLRVLLPPIPLPSDENFPDEHILPGALPPRGPPKAGGEGPNKGVSKLQLLMCGNDYIRQLKARVERRDEEIVKLRGEIIRLRHLVGDDRTRNFEEEMDLERDLDAIEVFSVGIGRGGSMMADDEADEDNDE